MKALTILQPWASLLACGAKKIETRSWKTNYRGKIAIHAGLSQKYCLFAEEEPFLSALEQFSKIRDIGGTTEAEYEDCIELEYGKILAIADLVGCYKINIADTEYRGKIVLLYNDEGLLMSQFYSSEKEIAFGNYSKGCYAWILENMEMIKEPIPAKGKQGLWNWEGEKK